MTDAQEFDLMSSDMPSVTIYSDGAYKPVLGTGGYGAIMTCNGYTKFLYGGFIGSSNNAMELSAVLAGIRLLDRPCKIHVISDSKYVVDGISSWMMKWAANDWRKSDGSIISNLDLWREMYMYAQRHLISVSWIKGHAGNFSNAVCDQFATIGSYKIAGATIPSNLISINRL